MNKIFETRTISGREIINPFRTENSKEHLASEADHSLNTLIDRLYWVEEELAQANEESEKLDKALDDYIEEVAETRSENEKLRKFIESWGKELHDSRGDNKQMYSDVTNFYECCNKILKESSNDE